MADAAAGGVGPAAGVLAGASVLVAGASGGLGSAMAQALRARGSLLTLAGRDPDRLAAVAGPGEATVTADLRTAGGVAEVVEAAVAAHGRLDGLVVAVGAVAFGPVGELTDEVLDELVAINLVVPVRLLRTALPYLRDAARTPRPGTVGQSFAVHLSAVVAENPVAGMAAYSATKAALSAFDAAVAREVRSARVRVLDVRPPHTETGLAGRPLAGTAPPLPHGLDPHDVVARVIRALDQGERDLPSAAFGS